MHVAARAITEIKVPKAQIMHLVHPRPVKWTVILNILSTQLKIPRTPYDNWLSSLEKYNSKADPQTVTSELTSNMVEKLPALRILDFFQKANTHRDGTEFEIMGLPNLSSAVAQTHTHALSESYLPQLNSEDVERWVQYWRKMKYLN